MSTDSSMKDCCMNPGAPLASASLQEGSVIDIASIPSYVVGSGPHFVFFCTDAFGYEFPNNREICNRFASEGFTVVMPKILNDGLSTNFDRSKFPEWLQRNSHAQANGWADTVMEALINDAETHAKLTKPKTIQLTGYCYGGKTVMHFVCERKFTDHINGAVVSHPSMLSEAEASEADLRVPMLFNCAEVDQSFSPEVKEKFRTVLLERGAKAQFLEYAGVSHGFAIRAVSGTDIEKERKEECTVNTIKFFKSNAK